MPDTKLYDIMGVDKNVSADELKSVSFHLLALLDTDPEYIEYVE